MPIPLLLPAVAGIGSFLGGLFKNKSKQTTTPTLDPAFGGMQAQILKLFQDRLRSGGPSLQGYQSQGIQDINKTYDLIGQRSTNDLTARGLGTSPVAGAVDASNQQARGGAIAQFNNSLPLLQNDLQMRDLLASLGLLGQGRGSTTTSTSGGGPGGGLENLFQMIGYLIGQGKLGGAKPGAAYG